MDSRLALLRVRGNDKLRLLRPVAGPAMTINMLTKNWTLKPSDSVLETMISRSFGLSSILARLLVNRGVTDHHDIKLFLNPDIHFLHDPFLLKGMKETVARIRLALERNERVMVYGDYDVDGVTAAALLTRLLRSMGIVAIPFIPHRMEHGYGLNHEIAVSAKEQGISLLITVDCGITAAAEVETIKAQGIDVVIIDHHEPEHGVPLATAVIDPKQPGCDYPFKGLAAVGLVAKVTQALMGEIDEETLDLVAIGTVADMAPLRNENRVFVKKGLGLIANSRNPGLRALLDVCKVDAKKLTPYHIGFILGPRINAAGRMDTAHTSLDLFLCEDTQQAYELARVLENHNLDRQRTQKSIVEEAIGLIESGSDDSKTQKVIVLGKQGWHKGVVGIVASQIKERYGRPAVVIAINEGVGTASARSVEGFHIQEALMSCSECLEAFGGHAGAAGLTIREEKIDRFTLMINEAADKIFARKILVPSLDIDSEILLSDVTLGLADCLDTMQPFGEGNPVPVFCSTGLRIKSSPALLGRNTLKFWVTDGKTTLSAVGFGMGDCAAELKTGQMIDLAYEIAIDDWNKAPTPQLKIRDIRIV